MAEIVVLAARVALVAVLLSEAGFSVAVLVMSARRRRARRPCGL